MDNTPPRNRLIALYGALAVVTLLALKPAFDAYFDFMHAAAVSESLEIGQDMAEVDRARAEWARGDDAIRAAMERLARQGRLATPQIRPMQTGEMDIGPLRGWLGDPREVSTPAAAVPPAVPERGEAPAAPSDAAPAEATAPAAPSPVTEPDAAQAPTPSPAPESERLIRRPRVARPRAAVPAGESSEPVEARAAPGATE